jgi:hypothetical protein
VAEAGLWCDAVHARADTPVHSLLHEASHALCMGGERRAVLDTDAGGDFAEEARKIHHGEVEARGIFGEATEDEAEALREEGIDIARIPWVPPSDA